MELERFLLVANDFFFLSFGVFFFRSIPPSPFVFFHPLLPGSPLLVGMPNPVDGFPSVFLEIFFGEVFYLKRCVFLGDSG